jgi:hypothetical protein
LAQSFKGFELGPVEMIQNPRLKKPSRPNRRTKPRVWLPYTGPKLFELWVTACVPMDKRHTTAKLVRDCKTCGSKRYELIGYEDREVLWDPRRMRGILVRKGRTPGQGLYVQKSALGEADIFRVREFDGWVLCTDRVVDFVQERGYSNVTFMEIGEVI